MLKLNKEYSPKILVYDIETDGVNALNADLGYIITFGYIWFDDYKKGKKWKTISIADYSEFKKNPHNDKYLIKDALKILDQADGIIHHYGNKFDAPYIVTRAVIKNLGPFPDVPMLDTCLLAWKRFKLSSNRLKNIAKVFKCKWQKLDKGNGWPMWWYEFLKGSAKYDKQMREYCGYDVMTLAEISDKMRPYWPPSFVNRLYPKTLGRHCNKCGSKELLSKGLKIFQRIECRQLRCKKCGSTANYEKINK